MTKSHNVTCHYEQLHGSRPAIAVVAGRRGEIAVCEECLDDMGYLPSSKGVQTIEQYLYEGLK